MAGDETVLLRGGSRDGETTTVADGVRRVVAPSEAPGMLDVYEATTETTRLRGNDDTVLVFTFAGLEPAEGIAPEAQHMPDTGSG